MSGKKMKRSLIKTLAAGLMTSFLVSSAANASGGGVHLEPANIDVKNQMSLLRGAKYYANYCQGCHSVKFSRYNRVAADAGVTDEQIGAIIFTNDEDGKRSKPGALMESAIPAKDAANWFGTAPPDLSLVGRSRSGDWIYNYLKSFYSDDSRPFGVNNTVFDNVGMPHVFLDLQGVQDPVYRYDIIHHGHDVVGTYTSDEDAKKALEEIRKFEVLELGLFGEGVSETFDTEAEAAAFVEKNTEYYVFLNKKEVESFESNAEAQAYIKANPVDGGKYKVKPVSDYSVSSSHKISKIVDHLELVKPGKQNPAQFDSTVRDVTNYLVYISEPAQLHRKMYGVLTLMFLALFFVFAYFLKKEYWKDVH